MMMNLKKIMITYSLFFSVTCSAQNVPVAKNGNRYTIKLQDQYLEMDPMNGGRITALNMGDTKFLTDSTVNVFNWGSTFWPSPQSDWNWPPPEEWDNKPYIADLKNNEVSMVGTKDPKTGLAVTKIFSGDKIKRFYNLKYVITNQSDSVRKVAAWEVTRVHTNGFSFFPLGKGDKRGGLISSTIDKDGICWYTYNHDSIPSKGDTQLYTDGSEGWFAQVNGDMILVKKFPDIALDASAPKEGEVELYANKTDADKSYVEIEHQGAYEEIKPGQSSTWNMKWYLRKLPVNIKPTAGNPKLIEYVRELVK
jgi:hypothetical protein